MVTIITGLPRTRTAWMSAFFDVEHEPLRTRCYDANLVREYGDQHKIICDCGAAFLYREVKAALPEAHWVFVLRPEADVRISLARIFPSLGMGVDSSLSVLSDALDRAMKAESGKCTILPFSLLDDIGPLIRIWEASKSIPWDQGRYERFIKLRIEAKEFSPRFITNH